MRVARFESDGGAATGVVLGDELADLGPLDPIELLAAGPAAIAAMAEAAATRVPLATARLLAPIPRPPKFLAIGLNYADHIAEADLAAPEFPVFFNKQTTCVIGPHDPIHVPRVSSLVDYEGELGIVTADEIADPQDLRIRTWVNGELLQDASTSGMVFDCAAQIETLSTAFTLEPGDIIATGTPAGVGIVRKPPIFLKPGDVVRIEIDGIGVLENPVIAEPDDTAVIA